MSHASRAAKVHIMYTTPGGRIRHKYIPCDSEAAAKKRAEKELENMRQDSSKAGYRFIASILPDDKDSVGYGYIPETII